MERCLQGDKVVWKTESLMGVGTYQMQDPEVQYGSDVLVDRYQTV